MEILKVGTRVKTYGPTGLNEENATLLERLEDDYSELMNTDDIEIPVHISSLQKWIVRFDGDSKATFARWIDPQKTLSVIEEDYMRKFKANQKVIVSENYKVRKGCVGIIEGGKNPPKEYLVKMSDGESFWIPEEFLKAFNEKSCENSQFTSDNL